MYAEKHKLEKGEKQEIVSNITLIKAQGVNCELLKQR